MIWRVFPANEFARYAQEWDQLNAIGPCSPVLHSDFIGPALAVFGRGNEKLVVFERDGAPVAMGLFQRTRLGVWDTFQPSQAPLGCWVDASGLSVDALLAKLIRALPGLVLQVGLTQQDPDLYPRPAESACVRTLDYIQTARISIDRPFDAYWAARGKNLRHNMKRQRNRLERDGVKLRLEILTLPEQMRSGVQDYGGLESAGWKAGGGTAIRADNPQGQFYIEMLERFCRRGHGRIYRYFYNDDLAATDLCIDHEGTLIVLKTTYDEAQDTTSPALLMRQEAFQQLFAEAGMRRIEFYGKVMEWHTKWSEEIRTMYHLNVCTRLVALFLRRSLLSASTLDS